MRKAFKRAVFAGILAGLAYAVWRAIQARVPAPANDVAWETAPVPVPAGPAPGSDRHERTAPTAEPAPGDEPATVGRTGRRRLPGLASGQGEAVERHLPRARRRELRPHPRGPLLRRRGRGRERRPAQVAALTRAATVATRDRSRGRARTPGSSMRTRDDLGRHERVGGDDHQRGLAARAPADVHVGDVDAGVAEHRCRPDRSCPGRVVVVHDEHVARGREVDGVLVDADDARRLLLAEQRAGDVRCGRRSRRARSMRFT